jgi:hypothetical protein
MVAGQELTPTESDCAALPAARVITLNKLIYMDKYPRYTLEGIRFRYYLYW